MSCLLLTSGGDIAITNGRTTLVTDPVQAGAIKLRTRFRLTRGSWFRDTRVGVPLFQDILVKPYSIPVVQNIIRQIIIATPPFVNATVTVTPPDAKTRTANIAFVAIVDPLVAAGATVTASALDAPFIVNMPGGATS